MSKVLRANPFLVKILFFFRKRAIYFSFGPFYATTPNVNTYFSYLNFLQGIHGNFFFIFLCCEERSCVQAPSSTRRSLVLNLMKSVPRPAISKNLECLGKGYSVIQHQNVISIPLRAAG